MSSLHIVQLSHRLVLYFYPKDGRSGRLQQAIYCDSAIGVEEGWIFTPYFPSDYNDSLLCTYTIQRFSHDVCEVELTFTDFDVEDTAPQCSSDYLDIGDGIRMCGILMPDTKSEFRAASAFDGLRRPATCSCLARLNLKAML